MDRQRPIFLETMKRAFWDGYDVLWRLILVNIVALVLAATVIGVPFALAGLAAFLKGTADGRPPSFSSIWNPRGKLGPVLTFLFVLLLSTLLMLFNVRIYLGPIRAAHPFVGLALAGTVVWFWIAIACIAGFWLALRLWRPDLKSAWKIAAILFLKHSGASIACFFQCASIFFLLAVSGAGLVVLGLGAPMLVWFELCRTVACREGLIEREREPEARTFRDLFRPWDS